MLYNTKKPYLVLLCYSDKKIVKSESVSALKTWASEIGVTNVTTEKTLTVSGDDSKAISLDGQVIFLLSYRLPTQTFFGWGYADEVQGNYCGNGIYSYEPDGQKYMAVYISLGKQEGEVLYG